MKQLICLALFPVILAACQSQTALPSDEFPQREWRYEDGADAPYLLAPGDALEIIVHSAPELSRTVTVGPDGRFRIPYSGPVRAAARTVEEVRLSVQAAMVSELKDPDIDVLLVSAASQRIFVGGEVHHAGMFDLPGQIDPLQAIIMAGGLTAKGEASTVILMRRLFGGDVKTAILDIEAGLYDPALADWGPLRRFDVVYVPRTRIADQNLFVRQYLREALPLDFFLFYEIGG